MKQFSRTIIFLLASIMAAVVVRAHPAQAQSVCFRETGFCLTEQRFLEYFRERGEHTSLGFPISRAFTLEGIRTQVFQRVVLQLRPETFGFSLTRLDVLDPGIMPITRANQSVFPAPDPEIVSRHPVVGQANYTGRVSELMSAVVPDTWNGLPVGFLTRFNTTVPIRPAVSPQIMLLLNLEIWGLPTSRPAFDPANPGFVYQRFQRGIMHFRQYDVSTAEGILVGELFGAVITGSRLPSDLEEDMAASRFLRQYDPSVPNRVARPEKLADTDLTNAFEPEVAGVAPTFQSCTQPARTGCPVEVGRPVEAVLDDAGRVHTWRLRAPPSGGALRVVLTNLPADYDLHLQGPDGRIVGESANEGTQDDVVEVSGIASGDLLIYVDLNPSRSVTSPSPYQLVVTLP